MAGASRGIGRAVAIGLARSGAAVAGLARSADALEQLGAEIGAEGGQFLAVEADIADVARIPDLVEEVWSWRGAIDGLLNSAGTTNRKSSLDITAEEWDRLFDVNLKGAFFLTREV
ncbi:MAG: SDR family oxidoreductase, partial [Actinobacteria bacterium]|nr:SDR family oxidoreductase [Actinomycetota bacterium]NIS32294.1 SDR family oxidoreductase [Actinomycetota bacterium]NIU19885.1 SDR family oxidoreductase [Actinomycetota bacterium]NIU67336.1 SDR family oxidoreductase [Actinomycetota bacterium]NIW29117.1 SDR family NAD(P)-dependent oxidoreductase [Actinomycetota bacterium]